jgi:predicted transcriptional regulator
MPSAPDHFFMEGMTMTTVTISVSPLNETMQRLAGAFRGTPQGGPHISFVSHELLWRVLAPNRWAILQVMTGAGPLALREIARRVNRDVKGVHTDVHALLNAGLIDRTAEGFEFPFNAVHVDFTMRAAA